MNPDQDLFNLLQSGVVSLKQSLATNDYERKNKYELYFVARELLSGLESDEIKLEVNVIDVNDNSPRFTQDLYLFNVTEHSPSGTVVGMVSAYDNDSSTANNMTSYSLLTSEFSHLFAINSSTGEISVIGEFIVVSMTKFK